MIFRVEGHFAWNATVFSEIFVKNPYRAVFWLQLNGGFLYNNRKFT